MKVTDGLNVLILLYQGTGKMFLQSKQGFGLGDRSPDVVTRSHRPLEELADLEAWDWLEDPGRCVAKSTFDNMRKQAVTEGSLNFRCGSAYVSPSLLTAVRYAISNRYGSELLSTVLFVLERRYTRDSAQARAIADRHQMIPAFEPRGISLCQLKHRICRLSIPRLFQ